MSSTGRIDIPNFQLPSFNEAAGVMAKIETQVGNIQNIFADVQALLAELRALEPPTKSETEKPEDFQKRVDSFNRQLATLNSKIEGTYRKLGQAQAILQRLQTSELPTADRKDVERIQAAATAATEALNKAARSGSEAKIDEKKPDAQDELRIELRVLDRKVDIRLADDASFKDVIKAFMLMGQIVGDAASLARKANSSVNMPPTPGSGLPPVGLP